MTKTDELFTKIRSKILSGDYKRGDVLRELDLAEEYGVSRTPVRESLRRLESDKLIKIIPNFGAMVNNLSWDDAREIFSIRIVLETYAAQSTTLLINQRKIDELKMLLEKQHQAVLINDISSYVLLDEEFHSIINESCGNKHLINLISSLNDRSKLTGIRHDTYKREGGVEKSYKRHVELVDAIEARNPTLVGKLFWEHSNHFYFGVVQNLNGFPFEE